MKKILRWLMVIFAIVLFVPQFAEASTNDFMKKVYAEKQLDGSFSVQMPQDIKTKNTQYILQSIEDVMNEFHSNIFFTQNNDTDYVKYVLKEDINYFNQLEIDSFSIVAMLNGSYSFEVKSFRDIDNSFDFNGVATIVCQDDKQKEMIITKLTSRLGVDVTLTEDYMGEVSVMAFSMIVMVAFGVLISLLIIYDQYRKYKLFAIKKMNGYSHFDILVDELSEVIGNQAVILFSVFTILTFLMTRSFNQHVQSFLINGFYSIVVSICISFVMVLIPVYLFTRVKIIDYLKNKKTQSLFMYFNQAVLMMIIVVGIFLTINGVTYANSIVSRFNNYSQWETMKDYYIIPYLNDNKEDVLKDKNWQERNKQFYLDVESRGAIFADFNDFYDDGSIVEGEYYEPRVAKVNNNYLKENKIYDVSNEIIQIDQKIENTVILLPDNKKYDEVMIRKDQAKMNNNKDKEITFIYYKSGQDFFSYNSKVYNKNTNSLQDIVLVVLTNKNGTSFDYQKAIGYKNNPLKIKAENEQEVASFLKKHGLDQYAVGCISAFDNMANLNQNEIGMFVGVVATILIVVLLIGKALYQGLYCYIDRYTQLIAIKRLHGYSIIKQYQGYFLLNIGMYMMIMFVFIFLQQNVIFVIGLIAIIAIISNAMLTYKIKKLLNTDMTTFLKGGSI